MWQEAERHELYQRLTDALGPDAAGALMRQLPPYEWTALATKADLEAAIQRELRATENTLRSEMHAQTRFLFFSTVGAVLTTAALTLSAATLAM